jgi:ABC-type antimicrobial peptide transport system permease subunit
VSERRREFGVRVALGAAPANLRALVFRDALAIVATGLALGVPAAFAASQLTQAFLFGVSSTAPHVFSAAAITLALAALAATVAPARRASRLDPVGALKDQ